MPRHANNEEHGAPAAEKKADLARFGILLACLVGELMIAPVVEANAMGVHVVRAMNVTISVAALLVVGLRPMAIVLWDYIQPAMNGPWMQGLTRIEYTIGVAGCGQRTTYVVICQEGTDTCFAANPDRQFRRE